MTLKTKQKKNELNKRFLVKMDQIVKATTLMTA